MVLCIVNLMQLIEAIDGFYKKLYYEECPLTPLETFFKNDSTQDIPTCELAFHNYKFHDEQTSNKRVFGSACTPHSFKVKY